jgi:hypothetical protein
MPHSEEKVLEIIKGIAAEIKFTRKIESATYRADWQDYQIIMDGTFHCEIREKLIDVLADDTIKDKVLRGDSRKEVEFRLSNPVEFEDWE